MADRFYPAAPFISREIKNRLEMSYYYFCKLPLWTSYVQYRKQITDSLMRGLHSAIFDLVCEVFHVMESYSTRQYKIK